MKLILNGTAYIQREDIVFIREFPQFLADEICSACIGSKPLTALVQFTKPESINYWAKAEEIVDYNAIQAMSEKEIQNEIQKLEEKLEAFSKEYLEAEQVRRSELSRDNERHKNRRKLQYQIETLHNFLIKRTEYDELFAALLASQT